MAVESPSICENCQRMRLLNGTPSFCTVANDSFNNVARYRNLKMKSSDEPVIEHTFCTQCYNHLILANSKNCWPDFIWSVLSDEKNKKRYPRNYIWRFISKRWRYWWIEAFNNERCVDDNLVIVEFPRPIFDDITSNIDAFNKDIDSYNLANLA